MRRAALLLAVLSGLGAAPATARETADASPPSALAVTLYRDPDRGADDALQRDYPQGFAMITETRTVTLPPGESTIRFTGVAEGMVAISAIVTGLPGGTIEKNRNAALLSPASLVDGTLGNRVTITRTNPATGAAVAEQGIVRTRADGGLVLQTESGFEAVRCSGLPVRLTFDRVPAGLSAQPVFSVDTRDPTGGTYTVQLSYLAWGFDWQAHYVATLAEGGDGDEVKLHLMSWLTLLNDNGQSFPDAELLVIAGRLNVDSDYQTLGEAPEAEPLRLTCYPIGSTARGSPIPQYRIAGVPPPAPVAERGGDEEYDYAADQAVVVTGSRIMARPAMVATEEQLGDLKLYRVPEPVTVAAQSLKQIVFLDRDNVEGRLLYEGRCAQYDEEDATAARLTFVTVNDRAHGLGQSLPMGGMTVFEPSAFGDQLVAEAAVRDYARGQDVELAFGDSSQVFVTCQGSGELDPYDRPGQWTPVTAMVSNANPDPVQVRLWLGWPGEWEFDTLRGSRIKDGQRIVEFTVPGGRRQITWRIRPTDDD